MSYAFVCFFFFSWMLRNADGSSHSTATSEETTACESLVTVQWCRWLSLWDVCQIQDRAQQCEPNWNRCSAVITAPRGTTSSVTARYRKIKILSPDAPLTVFSTSKSNFFAGLHGMDRWMDSKHPVNPGISVQNQNKLLDLSCLFRPSYSQFKNFHCLRFTGLSSSHKIQNHPGVQGRLRPIPVTVWTLEISFRCLHCHRTLPRPLCPLVLTFFLARDQSSHRIMLQIVMQLQAMGKTHSHTLHLPNLAWQQTTVTYLSTFDPLARLLFPGTWKDN